MSMVEMARPTRKAQKKEPAKVPTISDAAGLAWLESLEKGSEILKRSRNTVWRKLAEKEVDEPTLKVLREIVALKDWETLRTAYSVVRREQPKPEKVEKEEA